jgi:plasmid stabilization system protein ParE
MPCAVWTPVAESDLDDILFYIALVDRNPVTGERIYYEIRDRVTEQAEESSRSSTPGGTRRMALHQAQTLAHLLSAHAEGIEVMRVIDAVRDLPRHLRDS